MKNANYSIIIILALVHLFIISPAMAEERMKVFEMAESGITIEFRMTPVEIAAEGEYNKNREALNATQFDKMKKRLAFIEMGESGQTVSFPLTAGEIAAEKAASEQLAAIRVANSQGPKNQTVIFEMTESGETFEFPIESKNIAITDQYLANSANSVKLYDVN